MPCSRRRRASAHPPPTSRQVAARSGTAARRAPSADRNRDLCRARARRRAPTSALAHHPGRQPCGCRFTRRRELCQAATSDLGFTSRMHAPAEDWIAAGREALTRAAWAEARSFFEQALAMQKTETIEALEGLGV